MTIPEQVQNDYKRWRHFLEKEVKFSLSNNENTPMSTAPGYCYSLC